MTSRTKNSIYVLIATAAAVAATLMILKGIDNVYQQEDQLTRDDVINKNQAAQNNLLDYKSEKLGLEFKYPANIKVTESSQKIVLNHNIPFENHGTCDMRGDSKTYPTLDDFNVSIQTVSGNVAQAVKKLSPYMPAENFTKDSLKVNPGFIDQYQIGNLNGFYIYEGAEGCGHTVYYFPVTSNNTLVVTKDMVQQLSGVMSSNIREEILKVPGAISNEESDKILKQILASLTIASLKTYTGHTVYGDQYQFSVNYPNTWTLSGSRGAAALVKNQCQIVLGAGGHGLEGMEHLKDVKFTTFAGTNGTVSEYDDGANLLAFVNFPGEYIFEFTGPKTNTSCFNDYLDVVKSVRILTINK